MSSRYNFRQTAARAPNYSLKHIERPYYTNVADQNSEGQNDHMGEDSPHKAPTPEGSPNKNQTPAGSPTKSSVPPTDNTMTELISALKQITKGDKNKKVPLFDAPTFKGSATESFEQWL